jgi:hypothetical protein
MVNAGRLSTHTSTTHHQEEFVYGVSVGTEGTLLPEQLRDLQRMYKDSIADYKKILTEYENAAQRAVNYRTKSLFPSQELWNPHGRVLSSRDRELLVGPLPNITHLRKVTVRDPTTCRLIEYSCVNMPLISDQLPRRSSSFVMILHEPGPVFGVIIGLFSHIFGQINYWAIVQKFATVVYDQEVKMWHGCVNHLSNSVLVQLSQLSYPLIVGIDSTSVSSELWFLNSST